MSRKNKQKTTPNNKPSIPSGNNAIAIKPKWQHILLMILLTAMIYSNTLKNEFAYDDIPTIVENSLIKNLKNIPLFFIKPIISSSQNFRIGYRPLTMASFAINYKIGGLEVVGYHIVNIYFHACNTVLVYMLIIILLGIAKYSKNNVHIIALFISLLFAVHPINSEAVNYIWQRSVLMATFFYLLTVILFIKCLTEENYSLFLFSIFSYILALLSKEIAITVPFTIMLIDWYFISGLKKDCFLGNIKKYHFPFVFITFIFILIRFFNQSIIKVLVSSEKTTMFNYFITQFRVIIEYLRLIIIPKGLSVDHPFPISESITNVSVLLSFGAIITIILISIRLIKVSKIASLFMLWFFIALIPTSSVLPLKIIMNEHRLYLPGIGMIAAIVTLLFRITFKKFSIKYIYITLTIVVTILSVLTFNRNKDWKDRFTLWSKTLQIYPYSEKALNSLGNVYNEKGLHDKAIADYSKAIELNPELSQAYNNRGVAYDRAGFYDKAITDFNKVLELNPKNASGYNNRGVSYGKKGFYDKAIADYSKGIELYSEFPRADTYTNRGVAYGKKGLYDKAITDFNKAIELNPGFSKAYTNRSYAYKLMGKPSLAKQDEEKARVLQKQQQ